MSAQPTDQIGGSSPKSSLFTSLRGSFSSGLPAAPISPPLTPPLDPPSPPALDPPSPPAPPIEPELPVEQAPIDLEQVAQEVTSEPEEIISDDHLSESMPEEAVSKETVDQGLDPNTAEFGDAFAAAIPTAVDEMTDTLNPPQAGGGPAKEAPLLSVTVENPAVDQAGGVQYVETEKSHELPPEVEGFLKKVEDNVDQIPQEIVISDPQTGQQLPRVLATPVVILPITPQSEDEGKRKSENFSIRWLVEWSWKMMKVFSGKIVYRDGTSED